MPPARPHRSLPRAVHGLRPGGVHNNSSGAQINHHLHCIPFQRISPRPSVRPSVRSSVHFWGILFKLLFAPTSQSWMSDNFRDSESLGKSIEKKWSQIWNFVIIKGVKLQRNFFCVFFQANFALLTRTFLVSVLPSIMVERFFVSRMGDF